MAIKSFGVTVTVGGTSIGGLTDVTIPETDVTDIDITTHESTSGYKEFIGGLKDGGTVTLTGKYDATDGGQQKLSDAEEQGGEAVSCVVTFSDTSSATFNAVIKGYGVTNPLDDAVGFTASLKISGPITWAAGV